MLKSPGQSLAHLFRIVRRSPEGINRERRLGHGFKLLLLAKCPQREVLRPIPGALGPDNSRSHAPGWRVGRTPACGQRWLRSDGCLNAARQIPVNVVFQYFQLRARCQSNGDFVWPAQLLRSNLEDQERWRLSTNEVLRMENSLGKRFAQGASSVECAMIYCTIAQIA